MKLAFWERERDDTNSTVNLESVICPYNLMWLKLSCVHQMAPYLTSSGKATRLKGDSHNKTL